MIQQWHHRDLDPALSFYLFLVVFAVVMNSDYCEFGTELELLILSDIEASVVFTSRGTINGPRNFEWRSAIAGIWLGGCLLYEDVFIHGPGSHCRNGLKFMNGTCTRKEDAIVADSRTGSA